MEISVFSHYLQRLESTPKRLEITQILKELIDKLKPEETAQGIYLALGYIKAPFEDKKFNIAEKMMVRIIAQTYFSAKTPQPEEKVKILFHELGDLGNVTYKLASSVPDSKLSVRDIHASLFELADIEGTKSQESKSLKLSSLLKQLDPLSAKYITRIVLGTTRLGFTELTVIDALAEYLGDKSLQTAIEEKYSIHPDMGLVAEKLKEKGKKGLQDIKIEPGVPILAQRCQRVKSISEAIEKMGKVRVEYKFDGTRVQLHMDKNTLLTRTFTRNLEETSHMYPDLIDEAKRVVKADSVILDGEAIGYNKTTGEFLPFQEIMQRKRKHEVAETAKTIPLKYFVFDILYLNGKQLTDKPLKEREQILDGVIGKSDTIQTAQRTETDKAEDIERLFEEAKEKHLEGLILKRPADPYQAGARSFSWVKLKKADEKLLRDSVDCVVLGYYFGRGARAKFGIGGFLVGVYDDKSDTFKTVTKIGTGLKDEDWKKLKEMCDKIKIAEKPTNVDMTKAFTPNTFVQPKLVVEVGADEISVSPSHTAGYALRFPRLLKFRDDKSATEATTLGEIVSIYRAQKRGHL